MFLAHFSRQDGPCSPYPESIRHETGTFTWFLINTVLVRMLYVARGALVCLPSSHEQMTRDVEYARERLHFSDALYLLLHFAVSCLQLARFLYHNHHIGKLFGHTEA